MQGGGQQKFQKSGLGETRASILVLNLKSDLFLSNPAANDTVLLECTDWMLRHRNTIMIAADLRCLKKYFYIKNVFYAGSQLTTNSETLKGS